MPTSSSPYRPLPFSPPQGRGSAALTAVCLPVCVLLLQAAAEEPPAPDASQKHVIHLDADAPEMVRTAAEDLGRWLKAASGIELPVSTEPYQGAGIYLAVAGQDKHRQAPAGLSEMGSEGIYMKADGDGLYLVGNTELAVREGVYLYLEQLGFRWFMPHPAWYIIPKTDQFFSPLEVLDKPDYELRSIWSGYGTRTKLGDEQIDAWNRYNRMGGAFKSKTGHSYPAIIKRNAAEFEKHPEYFALLADGKRDTERPPAARKFCVSNEGLIQLCIDDALRQLAEDPKMQMVSMDPSDGKGSCECDTCLAIGNGSVSDRVFFLANRVAKAVAEKHPGKWVGLYAYSSHQMPTSIPLEPNLYVQIATAYNSTPYSIDELIEEWSKRVTKLGIREYYGVISWDWDMPGRSRGSNLAYLARTIPHFHKLKANAINAENMIGRVSRGLGWYVAAKLMWDTHADVDGLRNDFFDKCFGTARPPMEDLFERWQNNYNAFPTEHDLAVWLRLVQEADSLAADDATRARIDQVKYYLHFVALLRDYKAASEEERYQKSEEMLRYGWRIRELGVSSSYAIARIAHKMHGKADPIPELHVRNPKCVWINDNKPVTKEELDLLIAADASRYREIEGLKSVGYAPPFTTLHRESGAPYHANQYRGEHHFMVEVPAGGNPPLAITAGFIKKGGKVSCRLYRIDQEIDDEDEKPVGEQSFLADLQPHEIDFKGLPAGFYRLIIDERRAGFSIAPGSDLNLSIMAEGARQIWTTRRSNFYLYVPPGTSKFAIVTTGPLTLVKANGEKVETPREQILREIDVAPNEHGVWQAQEQVGRFYLVGIPPVAGLTPNRFPVPASAE